MEALRAFAARDDVRRIAEAALERRGVQGVTVDFDPFWLLGWQTRMATTEREFALWDREMSRPWHPWLLDLPGRGGRLGPAGGPAGPFGLDPCPPDPSFTFSTWKELTEERGTGPEPYVVKVVRRPGGEEAAPLDLELPIEALRVVFETRPVARADSRARTTDRVRPLVGGVSCGVAGREGGTLGGVLEAADGTRYALTCSHVVGSAATVVEQPASKDRAAAAADIGVCVARTTLQAPSSFCNPYAQRGDAVDAALVQLDEGVSSRREVRGVGRLAGSMPARALSSGALAEISGKRSRHRRVRIGGLVVSHLIDVEGQSQCFSDLFELRSPSHLWAAAGTVRPPVRGGDSGAWVIAQGAGGPEWCGVVIGGDGPVGFASFSERVEDWLQTQGFGPLSV